MTGVAIPLRRRLRRVRRRARPLLLVAFTGSLLLLVLVAAAALRLPALRGELMTAREGLTHAQASLRTGDSSAARAQVAEADRAAAAARASTRSVTWRLVRRLPGVRTPFDELSTVADVTARTTSDVARPLTALDLTPGRWTGRLDTAALAAARGPLASAERSLTKSRSMLAAAPSARLAPLGKARVELTTALSALAGTVREARIAADVLPPLVGGDRTRRYFVAIQNPAEQRATGGLIGAYGILRADKGRLTLDRVGANNELRDATRPVVDLGPEFARRYARFGSASGWRSANLSPDVPTVGRILTALWADRTGEELDGVLLLDPAALGLMLAATGPVALGDGTQLTSTNASDVLLRDVYEKFPRAADAQRNDYLQQATRRVFDRLSRPGLNPRRLLAQAARAVGTGHILAWSTDAALEARLATSVAGGALQSTAPYFRVVTQDAGGSKLGYYLRQDASYRSRRTGEAVDLGAGPQPEEEASVRVRLTNAAPARGLPEYVTLRADAPDGRPRPLGQLKSWVSVYLGPRATLLSATLDGRPVALSSDTEKGLAVFSTFVSIDPGGTSTLVLQVRQPTGPDARS